MPFDELLAWLDLSADDSVVLLLSSGATLGPGAVVAVDRDTKGNARRLLFVVEQERNKRVELSLDPRAIVGVQALKG